MNEVMWREVMGFRNMPEQRCLLQGVLNPWHAGFPLWVPGLLAGPSAGARGWLSFRRGSRRARSSGDQCVLNDAGEAACTSESLGSSRWWWWWGAPDPRSPTRTGPDYRGGEEGSWGAVLVSPLQTYKEGALGLLWERRGFVVLGSLGDPPKIPHYFM